MEWLNPWILLSILLIFCCLCQPIAVVPKPQGNTCVTRQSIISLALLYVVLIIIMHVGFHGPVSSQNVLYNGKLLPEFCFTVISMKAWIDLIFRGNVKSWLILNIVEFYLSGDENFLLSKLKQRISFIISGHISCINFCTLFFCLIAGRF